MGRFNESSKDLDSRALAGTIWSQIAENLATRDLERHILYCGDARVKLAESLDFKQSAPPIIAWKPSGALLFPAIRTTTERSSATVVSVQ